MSGSHLTTADIAWDNDGVPRSRLYGDVYFSADGGLEESRTVFLEGCDLPRSWLGRETFCVAELGFGPGRNIAALLDLWLRTRPPSGHLSIFSVEAHPMRATDARRALAIWPEIAPAARLLTDRWPGAARGFHRIDLPQARATLDVAVMEAGEALAAWQGLADAWFLDGFSPARNPLIWRPTVMALVRARSAPGARIASYTVARSVRDALADTGFEVVRAPGFAGKRQRLVGRLPGASTPRGCPPRVALVGAGIAGASLRRAFLSLGVEAVVFDPLPPGGGASGGPAALAAPRLDAGLGPTAELFAQAARRAGQLYRVIPGAVLSAGALQIAQGAKDARRFAAIAASDLFEADAMTPLTADQTAALLGEDTVRRGLLIADAVVVSPDAILRAWLGANRPDHIAGVARVGDAWRLIGADGAILFEADVVCLAAGMGTSDLLAGTGLVAVRGQSSLATGVIWPMATLFGGYVIPTADGLVFGATHQRGRSDTELDAADDAENLDGVATVLPALASRLRESTRRGWAAVRATTRDFLPVAGPARQNPDGLMVLSGLGSRGFCLAPLLAEHVAALALGVPSPLPAAIAALVRPGRFAERARRRGRLPVTAEETPP